MKPNEVDSQGRTYYRCPYCGDSSKNVNKCHYFIDKNGNGYCFRCNYSHVVPVEAMLQIALGNASIDEVIERTWVAPSELTQNKRKLRNTNLSNFGDSSSDLFPMYNQHGKMVGMHERPLNEKGINTGNRGINWVGSKDILLKSSFSSHLVVVEGPYDVIDDNYVTVFGTITPSSCKYLYAHYVWLWPDPDIINSEEKREHFVKNVQLIANNTAFVQGIIVSNRDPDEHTIKFNIPYHKLNYWLKNGTMKTVGLQ